MTSRKNKPTSTSQQAYTVDKIPIAFNRKYVMFTYRHIPKPGISLPVIGFTVADNMTRAKQQFARERGIEEKWLFAQRWLDATIAEREEAQELQAEWEAQQREDQAEDNIFDLEDYIKREGLREHVSDVIQREPLKREETLRELYDRTVETLGREGYLD